MEGVKRTNVVMVNPQHQWIVFVSQHNPYTMDIDRKRNYYNCGGFGHIA